MTENTIFYRVFSYPQVGDENWFELLMSWCGSVTTATLTSAIKDEILARLLHDEVDDDDDDDNATQAVVS